MHCPFDFENTFCTQAKGPTAWQGPLQKIKRFCDVLRSHGITITHVFIYLLL